MELGGIDISKKHVVNTIEIQNRYDCGITTAKRWKILKNLSPKNLIYRQPVYGNDVNVNIYSKPLNRGII
jgi:hypothetical protein